MEIRWAALSRVPATSPAVYRMGLNRESERPKNGGGDGRDGGRTRTDLPISRVSSGTISGLSFSNSVCKWNAQGVGG